MSAAMSLRAGRFPEGCYHPLVPAIATLAERAVGKTTAIVKPILEKCMQRHYRERAWDRRAALGLRDDFVLCREESATSPGSVAGSVLPKKLRSPCGSPADPEKHVKLLRDFPSPCCRQVSRGSTSILILRNICCRVKCLEPFQNP